MCLYSPRINSHIQVATSAYKVITCRLTVWTQFQSIYTFKSLFHQDLVYRVKSKCFAALAYLLGSHNYRSSLARSLCLWNLCTMFRFQLVSSAIYTSKCFNCLVACGQRAISFAKVGTILLVLFVISLVWSKSSTGTRALHTSCYIFHSLVRIFILNQEFLLSYI